MVKNKSKLAIKLFIIVWIVLAVHIVLKLTFNYWQPYVIPNETLGAISDFIDSHRLLKDTIDGILYFINGLLMILCSIKCWWFKSKKQSIIVIVALILSYLHMIFFGQSSLFTLIFYFAVPLIIDKKKWLYALMTFLLSNVFMILSLFLEGFVNSDDMQYICKVFLQFDYYIMLILNYFVFNFIRKDT